MEYTTRELTQEEGDALSKDLQEVLEKHNAELGVISTIQLLKREEVVKSPYEGESTDPKGFEVKT